ncbi:hypothetical protein EW146_g1619 [Bondarzewia mesenterica]|uniref:DUF6532 domain-containing protein n=1 Tax=Bondarzewia mesenterica TaxID=1095465 RepID=A0A4S4M5I9_9AGAM|nr:hypothetical protein EW146_g1619 [Bondarzewia mesenterica]
MITVGADLSCIYRKNSKIGDLMDQLDELKPEFWTTELLEMGLRELRETENAVQNVLQDHTTMHPSSSHHDYAELLAQQFHNSDAALIEANTATLSEESDLWQMPSMPGHTNWPMSSTLQMLQQGTSEMLPIPTGLKDNLSYLPHIGELQHIEEPMTLRIPSISRRSFSNRTDHRHQPYRGRQASITMPALPSISRPSTSSSSVPPSSTILPDLRSPPPSIPLSSHPLNPPWIAPGPSLAMNPRPIGRARSSNNEKSALQYANSLICIRILTENAMPDKSEVKVWVQEASTMASERFSIPFYPRHHDAMRDSINTVRGWFKTAAEKCGDFYALHRPIEREKEISDADWKLGKIQEWTYLRDKYIHIYPDEDVEDEHGKNRIQHFQRATIETVIHDVLFLDADMPGHRLFNQLFNDTGMISNETIALASISLRILLDSFAEGYHTLTHFSADKYWPLYLILMQLMAAIEQGFFGPDAKDDFIKLKQGILRRGRRVFSFILLNQTSLSHHAGNFNLIVQCIRRIFNKLFYV